MSSGSTEPSSWVLQGWSVVQGRGGCSPSSLLLGRLLLQEAFPEMLLFPHPFPPPPISFLPLLPCPLPFLGIGPAPHPPTPAGHPGVQRGRKENSARFVLVVFPWGDENINTAIPRARCSQGWAWCGRMSWWTRLHSSHPLPPPLGLPPTPHPVPSACTFLVLSINQMVQDPLGPSNSVCYFIPGKHIMRGKVIQGLILNCYYPQFTDVEN